MLPKRDQNTQLLASRPSISSLVYWTSQTGKSCLQLTEPCSSKSFFSECNINCKPTSKVTRQEKPRVRPMKTKVEGTCLPRVVILALKKQQWCNPSNSCKLTWPLHFRINAAELAQATHNSMGRSGALSCQELKSISTATAAAHQN